MRSTSVASREPEPVHLSPVSGNTLSLSVYRDKLREDVACEVNKMANGNTKPIKKFQAGGVSAAVWKNTLQLSSGREGTVLSVTLDRAFKNSDGEWQHTGSMRLNDLPKAILVLTQAYTYMATTHEDEDNATDGDAE